MKHVITALLTLSLVASANVSFARNDNPRGQKQFRILRHEHLQLQDVDAGQQSRSAPAPDAQQAAPNATRTMSFTALGQRFTLDLESNDRLFASVPSEQRNSLSGLRLYRGTIRGISDSWVRLTQNGEQWSGMLWDGVEAYLIDLSDDVALALPSVARQGRSRSITYRLSETVLDGSCMVEGDAAPLNDFKAFSQQLQQEALALPAATRQLNLAIVADTQFVQANSNPQAAVLARMNVVDGIYSNQVGVRLNVVAIRPLTNNGPLTSTDPGTLLNQFGTFVTSPGFTNPGLSHLFTGRDMNGGVIGIAFLRAICNPRLGVGISETRGTGTAGALTVAHEIGHNFGAPHDNQGGSACASTPGTFIMNPFLNGSDQFSSCSLSQMQPVIAGASCITPITTPPPPPPPAGTIFTARFNANADGFTYVDDAFGTAQPTFAIGQFSPSVGFSGGGLQILLGGLNDTTVLNMSGGWRRVFSLPAARRVTVSLRYNLTQAANYESDELSDALLTIDGRRVGTGGNAFLARIAGNGNGGTPRTTGWVVVQVDLGTLSAGNHTLTIGGFNNKKTFRDEVTDIRIDDVIVTAQ